MSIIFVDDPIIGGAEKWREAMKARLPGIPFRLSTEPGDPADVEFALCFRAMPGTFDGMSNLKAILATGAGVDGLFSAPDLPDAPIARIVDPWMAEHMVGWATYAVQHFYRRFGAYDALQQQAVWEELESWQGAPPKVGLLGYGAIGAKVGASLAGMGFEIAAWTRGPWDIPGVTHYHGADGLAPFLGQSHFLICLLPLTDATEGILNADTLALLPKPAYLINLGRGRHVETDDLVAALRSEVLAGAFLDVTEPEPLPADHPLWSMENVRITPHCSGPTNAATAADQVADNIRRVLAGEEMQNLVARDRGY
ncbi:MAG: 2-hydroxyacid dehydrogenase [Alphaproteobacteria bacterium]|jgi:glyoxylate/hydroxypyruvate reductase A